MRDYGSRPAKARDFWRSREDKQEDPQQSASRRPRWNDAHASAKKEKENLALGANAKMALTCKVQYLDDTDPFASTNFPEPTRPPTYTFHLTIALCQQIDGLHRLLCAPHAVCPLCFDDLFSRSFLRLSGRNFSLCIDCC